MCLVILICALIVLAAMAILGACWLAKERQRRQDEEQCRIFFREAFAPFYQSAKYEKMSLQLPKEWEAIQPTNNKHSQ